VRAPHPKKPSCCFLFGLSRQGAIKRYTVKESGEPTSWEVRSPFSLNGSGGSPNTLTDEVPKCQKGAQGASGTFVTSSPWGFRGTHDHTPKVEHARRGAPLHGVLHHRASEQSKRTDLFIALLFKPPAQQLELLPVAGGLDADLLVGKLGVPGSST
jgi:hypothetical protein